MGFYEDQIAQPELREFKDKPILALPCGGQSFSFGLSKARAIMENIPYIRAFVESDGKSIKVLED